jgi:uncharacterized membrane protein
MKYVSTNIKSGIHITCVHARPQMRAGYFYERKRIQQEPLRLSSDVTVWRSQSPTQLGGGNPMVRIERNILINAPVEKVFAYHSDPENSPEYWPSFQEVKDIEMLPNGGKKYNWVYKMAGIRLNGSTTTTEFEENKQLSIKSEGGIDSTFSYTYQTEGDGTRLNLVVEYTVPVPVLGKLAESFILKMNEREADTVMANLKDILEV